VIPLAEERLLRGIIQPQLLVAWGTLPALAITAVLFSLKHAIVDASLGRLLAITAGGLVLGIVAYRAGHGDSRQDGWHASAVSHVVGNLVATSLGLLAMSQ
jgi:membrane protease YdiL (CAAX protease family)